MKWLGYSWRVLVNLFYLAIVGLVLIGISNPMEKSIISVLGMLYVTIRSIAIGQALMAMGTLTLLQNQIDQIRYHVDHSFEIPDHTEVLDTANRTRVKLYIDGCFLALTSLSCLVAFFTAHN